jgi:hypothetical protein
MRASRENFWNFIDQTVSPNFWKKMGVIAYSVLGLSGLYYYFGSPGDCVYRCLWEDKEIFGLFVEKRASIPWRGGRHESVMFFQTNNGKVNLVSPNPSGGDVLWDQLQPGDSVAKIKDSLYFTIFRADTTIRVSIDY